MRKLLFISLLCLTACTPTKTKFYCGTPVGGVQGQGFKDKSGNVFLTVESGAQATIPWADCIEVTKE